MGPRMAQAIRDQSPAEFVSQMQRSGSQSNQSNSCGKGFRQASHLRCHFFRLGLVNASLRDHSTSTRLVMHPFTLQPGLEYRSEPRKDLSSLTLC